MNTNSLTRQEAAQLLGVSMTATPLQIRKAFRRLAKSVHPDVNPSPEAKEQFIRLQEVQRVLLEPRSYDKFAPPKQNYDGWMHRSQQVARDFSKRYVDPQDVMVNAAIEPFFIGLLRIAAIAILLANPFLLDSEILTSIPWMLANSAATLLLFFLRHQPSRQFLGAAKVLLGNYIFLIIASFVFNVILFWVIGFRTFLALPFQLAVLFGIPFLCLLFYYWKDKLESLSAKKFFSSFVLGLVFNLVLLINFFTAKPYCSGVWNWRYKQVMLQERFVAREESLIIDKRLQTKVEAYHKLRRYDMPIVLKKGLLFKCMEY